MSLNVAGQNALVPAQHDQGVLPRHSFRRDDRLSPRREPPTTRPKRLVQDPPVLDFREVDDAVVLHLHVGRVDGCEERL